MTFDFAHYLSMSFGQPNRLIELGKTHKNFEKELVPHQDLQKQTVRKYRKWLKHQGPELSVRERRLLFWSLECEVDGQKPLIFVPQELRSALEWKARYRMIRGLILAFFNTYLRLPNVWRQELGEILTNLVDQCESQRSTALYWRREGSKFFSNDGVSWAVQKVISLGGDWQAWESLQISLQSEFIQRAIEERIHIFTKQNKASDLPGLLPWVESEFIKPETKIRVINQLLTPFVNKEWSEGIGGNLFFGFCVQYMGDPRLSQSLRWREISYEKKQLIVQWLSLQDINLFFTTISMHPDRKKFWMRYVQRMSYSRIALSWAILANPPEGLVEFIKQRRYAELTQAECAFIMRIGEYVIVEFSRSGNACYIYKFSQLPFAIDAPRYTTVELKNQSAAHFRLTHTGAWYDNFDRILRQL